MPEAVDGQKPKVFISYSRKDLDAAERLRDRLIGLGFEAYLDKHDILPGEPWQERLGALIATADTVVFLISPDSIESKICDWEVNEAERLGKRLLPVVIRDGDAEKVPGRLKRLNYVFLRGEAEEAEAHSKLRTALLTDIDWIREHTRMGELALAWEKGSRVDDLLLRGGALSAAELWLGSRPREAPEPTALHRDFLRVSREGETARLEAEKARLAEVEVAQAKRRRAQQRTGVVLSMMLLGVVGGGWGVWEFWRSVQRNRSEFVGTLTLDQFRRTDAPVTAMLLGLEGLPDHTSKAPVSRLMPQEAAAQRALDGAFRDWDMRSWAERPPLHGHTGNIYSVEFSPDGKLLASASDDGTARLWDATTGASISTLSGGSSPVKVLDFAPDGTRIATGSDDGVVRIWDTASRKLAATLAGHKAEIETVTFSPDGRLLASASRDNTARLWDSSSGRLVAELTGHKDIVYGFVFSPDGRVAATYSQDRTAILWDVATGKVIRTLSGHEDAVNALAFSPDGRLIATGSLDTSARLWEAGTGGLVATLSGHNGAVASVAFSPDSNRLLTQSPDKTARLWEVSTAKLIATLAGHAEPVRATAWSSDGKHIATASWDATIRLWNGATGKLLANLVGHEGPIVAIAFSPDGDWIASGSFDQTVRLWKATAGKGNESFTEYKGRVGKLAVSPDGQLLATDFEQNSVRLWNAITGMPVATLEGGEGAVTSISFSPDGRFLATGSEDSAARLWKVPAGKLIAELRGYDGVQITHFSENGQVLLTSDGETLQLWDGTTGKRLSSPAYDKGAAINSIALSPDGRLVATGSYQAAARIWDVRTGKPVADLVGHEDSVHELAFSPDGRILATASVDNTARLWEAATGQPLATLSHSDIVYDVAFSRDSHAVATASRDESVGLWSVADGTIITMLSGHSSLVDNVEISPDGRLVMAGTEDARIHLWDVASGKQTAILRRLDEALRGEAGHEARVVSAVFSPDGRHVVAEYEDGVARLWPIASSTQALVDEVKSIVPRCLSPAQRKVFHLAPEAPRWCYERKLWPYHDKEPPRYGWDEQFVIMWDRLVAYVRPRKS